MLGHETCERGSCTKSSSERAASGSFLYQAELEHKHREAELALSCKASLQQQVRQLLDDLTAVKMELAALHNQEESQEMV